MKFLPEEFDEILNIFRDESDEIIQKINSNLLHLEENREDDQIILNLFQNAHSLKGAARMVGFYNIQNLAHKIEDILGLIKDKKLLPTKPLCDVLYKTTDFISFLVQNSVKAKEDFNCESIDLYNQILDDAIEGKINASGYKDFFAENENEKQNFIDQADNISALFLESILILKKYNNEEKESYTIILSEKINNLSDIFKNLKLPEITEQIDTLKAIFNEKIRNSESISETQLIIMQEQIIKIINDVNAVLESLEINKIDYQIILEEETNLAEQNTEDTEKAKPEENKEDSGDDLTSIKEILGYLSHNISQIKFDKSYIDNSQKHILSILNSKLNTETTKIYKKIYDILEQMKSLKVQPDNDVIAIITQSINITKKIIMDSSNEEGEDLSLLLQRLSIVEQMIDINETKPNNLIPDVSAKKSVEPEFQKVQDFFKTFDIGTIKTLRVDTTKLDNLISQTGELIINGIKTKKHLSELQKLNFKLDDWNSLFRKTLNYIKYYEKKSTTRSDYSDNNSNLTKQLLNLFQNNLSEVNDLIGNVDKLYKKIHEDDVKLNHIILEIENIVKNIRVLPLATVFHMLPRMVRDIAENNGKAVELLISGSETTVDKKIIEEIKMPLIHILRNSIDHGIETPEERIKNNKPPVGQIFLSARYEENKIIIEVQDDGTGINLNKVKEKALEKGLLTREEINSMTDEQITNIIFYPGFSTGNEITEISGRGIGLDIVQTKISQLNGKVKVYSIMNKGAKIVIELPISMSTIKCFIVDVGGYKFAVPMNAIKNVQWVDTDKIFVKDGYNAIIIDNNTIPIIDSTEALKLKLGYNRGKRVTVVVVESDNSKVAYIVDKLLGDQEILHKKLSAPIYKLKNISGITTLASGDVCLILNTTELIKNTLKRLEKGHETTILIDSKIQKKSKNEYQIMIVDDSKSTLSLLERILLAEGYAVKAFSNPISAFERLKYDSFDLIISDVEMPSLNGKEFISQVKNDEVLSAIPIMIISTLETKKIKEEFKDFRINAFIHKTEFNRNEFILNVSNILQNDE